MEMFPSAKIKTNSADSCTNTLSKHDDGHFKECIVEIASSLTELNLCVVRVMRKLHATAFSLLLFERQTAYEMGANSARAGFILIYTFR